MNAQEIRTFKHELRTPINHIIGYSELLLESADDGGFESVARHAVALRSDGEIIARLIERHLSGWDGRWGCASDAEFRSRMDDALDRVLRNSAPDGELAAEPWAQDLCRIRSAACRLAQLVDMFMAGALQLQAESSNDDQTVSSSRD